jgi:3'-phosphoadenosine 5'-phosphosulfate sulfotransferase (PAPS reductase)/FAD synthetase
VRGLAVLEQAAERHDRIAIAVSFQKESSVIVDLAQQVMRTHPTRFDLFTLDTGVLFDETRDAWRRFEDHFGVEVAGVRGEWPERLWETDPDACCAARKTVPLRERLAGYDAWVTGLRREQSASRAETPFVAWDGRPGRARGVGAHPRARPALPRAPRPGLRLHRLRAVHTARRVARRALERDGQGRVRDPCLSP